MRGAGTAAAPSPDTDKHHQGGGDIGAPTPTKNPPPPIYIPGGGSIETWDFCLDNDYNYSYLSFTGYLRGKKLLDGYWDQVAKRGRDESPYRGAFAQTICVAETDQEAEKLYAEHVNYI